MSQGSPPRMEIGGLFPGEYPGDLRAPESSLAHHLICLEEVRRGGIVSPRAWAVLRFTTSSNLSGRSTGIWLATVVWG